MKRTGRAFPVFTVILAGMLLLSLAGCAKAPVPAAAAVSTEAPTAPPATETPVPTPTLTPTPEPTVPPEMFERIREYVLTKGTPKSSDDLTFANLEYAVGAGLPPISIGAGAEVDIIVIGFTEQRMDGPYRYYPSYFTNVSFEKGDRLLGYSVQYSMIDGLVSGGMRSVRTKRGERVPLAGVTAGTLWDFPSAIDESGDPVDAEFYAVFSRRIQVVLNGLADFLEAAELGTLADLGLVNYSPAPVEGSLYITLPDEIVPPSNAVYYVPSDGEPILVFEP